MCDNKHRTVSIQRTRGWNRLQPGSAGQDNEILRREPIKSQVGEISFLRGLRVSCATFILVEAMMPQIRMVSEDFYD
jgi:hypothetical protein